MSVLICEAFAWFDLQDLQPIICENLKNSTVLSAVSVLFGGSLPSHRWFAWYEGLWFVLDYSVT